MPHRVSVRVFAYDVRQSQWLICPRLSQRPATWMLLALPAPCWRPLRSSWTRDFVRLRHQVLKLRSISIRLRQVIQVKLRVPRMWRAWPVPNVHSSTSRMNICRNMRPWLRWKSENTRRKQLESKIAVAMNVNVTCDLLRDAPSLYSFLTQTNSFLLNARFECLLSHVLECSCTDECLIRWYWKWTTSLSMHKVKRLKIRVIIPSWFKINRRESNDRSLKKNDYLLSWVLRMNQNSSDQVRYVRDLKYRIDLWMISWRKKALHCPRNSACPSGFLRALLVTKSVTLFDFDHHWINSYRLVKTLSNKLLLTPSSSKSCPSPIILKVASLKSLEI